MCWSLFVVGCMCDVVCCLFVICCLVCVVLRLLLVRGSCVLFAVGWLLCIVYGLLFVKCWSVLCYGVVLFWCVVVALYCCFVIMM